MLCIPRGLYLYLEGAQTVPDTVENLRKGITLGGLDTFSSISKIAQDYSKLTVPFMLMKKNRTQFTTEDTLRVVMESMHDSMYESSKTLVKQLDKIGDKLVNVVFQDFQKKQSSTNSRGRDNSRDNYRNRSRDRRDSRDNGRDRGRCRDRSNSRDGRRNQQRSGSGQRYVDKNYFCNYCNKTVIQGVSD